MPSCKLSPSDPEQLTSGTCTFRLRLEQTSICVTVSVE